ncbi:MAG: D-glycero-beta-D-manno-heptose 1-phosphate adenylyltransferase, partial [Alphaproteobacteria bacterium]|nr:D-glycero-beta-D-manno-heptose 1-phosphate adenylyltransferase [Alphaproteobacteria bacterium]
FIQGEVSRVSAEAPIPVLAHGEASAMLGGAANVARNVVALGGRAVLVGLRGDDAEGEALARMAAEAGIAAFLTVDESRPTTLKVRFSASGQQLLRVDTEQTHPASGPAEVSLVKAIANLNDEIEAVLISDYGKGAVTPEVIAACHALAARMGAPVIVDSKAQGFSQYGPVDLIKPNAQELARVTRCETETDAEIAQALEIAFAACQAKAFLVTRSAKGVSLAGRGEAVRHYALPPPEVFDTAGAGDTALAALGLALAGGVGADAAARLALLASWKVVQKAGVAVVTPDELIAAVLETSPSPIEAKVVSRDHAARAAARWREQGLRVGFTNGCFDLLHPGHVASLTEARSWCDRLIVGLNTDESVRRAKGPSRPVNALEARALVLAGLQAVDLVAPFAEDTPLELIRAVRPDVLIKGADYAREDVVGHDLVEGWGGEVRLTAMVEGQSTTATLARMREGAA